MRNLTQLNINKMLRRRKHTSAQFNTNKTMLKHKINQNPVHIF